MNNIVAGAVVGGGGNQPANQLGSALTPGTNTGSPLPDYRHTSRR